LEFIRFSFGFPEEYEVLARTEQGFWATQFDFLYECDAPLDELHEAASIVGFRFLDHLILACEKTNLDTFELHRTWLRNLVLGIDEESGGPGR
jgi:hypothetical protein